MDNMKRKALQLWQTTQSRAFAVGLLFLSLALTIYGITTLTKAVYIRDGEELTLAYTTQSDAGDILREQGIVTMAYDSVDFSGFQGKVGEITIQRAFPVSLQVNGERTEMMMTGGTVSDLLAQQQITLEEADILSHAPGMFLAPGDEIVLMQVRSATRMVEEALPFETVVRETSLIPVGRTRLLQEGKDGKQVHTYEQVTTGGEAAEEVLVSTELIRQPMERITLKGTGAAVSPLDFDIPMDENGKPTQYTRLLQNQVATGYSAGKGAWGASGMDLHYGYVAVDPAVIPYGTRLYIATPDNSFVYGYAIAADTGVGLLGGVIDVDLYYETYLESCLNGRRSVEIYILD